MSPRATRPVLDSARFGRTPVLFLLGLAACCLVAIVALALVVVQRGPAPDPGRPAARAAADSAARGAHPVPGPAGAGAARPARRDLRRGGGHRGHHRPARPRAAHRRDHHPGARTARERRGRGLRRARRSAARSSRRHSTGWSCSPCSPRAARRSTASRTAWSTGPWSASASRWWPTCTPTPWPGTPARARLAEEFARRGIFGPVFQALFTSLIGLGVAYAAARPRGPARYLAIFAGWVAAVALDALWNHSAGEGGTGLQVTYVILIVALAAVVVAVIADRRRVVGLIVSFLPDFEDPEVVTADDIRMLASLRLRRLGRHWARLNLGIDGRRAMTRVPARRHRACHGLPPQEPAARRPRRPTLGTATTR